MVISDIGEIDSNDEFFHVILRGIDKQDIFLSEKIEDREYLKTVCRYIHKNPEKAEIEKTEHYRWSSYKEYTSF